MTFGPDLLRGSLDLLILSELGRGQQYGYQILTALRERSGGRIDLKAGTLYPVLHRLEHEGSVKSHWEDSTGRERKWYALTAAGRARLARDAREWLDFAACVRRVIRPALGSLPGVSPGAADASGATA